MVEVPDIIADLDRHMSALFRVRGASAVTPRRRLRLVVRCFPCAPAERADMDRDPLMQPIDANTTSFGGFRAEIAPAFGESFLVSCIHLKSLRC